MTDRSDAGSRGDDRDLGPATDGPTIPMEAVARRTPTGWRIGDEEVPERTSPAESGASGARERGPVSRPGAHRAEETPFGPADAAALRETEQFREAEQLKETVAQLERALTVRVRVEQAIGVLAERHRIRPRQAFELLRSASRARGQRIMETAGQVIASATNPLLRLPEELAKPPMPRRMPRRSRGEA